MESGCKQHIFQERWTENYFFIPFKANFMCSIYLHTIFAFEEDN